MPTSPNPDRRTRILEAAESAFADFGFAGASLRQIVVEAKVNLATVYYYFDCKRGLMEAVLKRRFGPLRQEQLELLQRFGQEANGQPLPLERLLEALLLPPLRLAVAANRLAVARLIGRIVTEPNPETQEILRGQHAEVRPAFLKAFQATLPGVPLPNLCWRLEFLYGALAFILCNPRKIEEETRGACNPVNTAKVLAEMVGFFAPGFRAPPPPTQGTAGKSKRSKTEKAKA